jgi:hypothetical protein
MEIDQQLSWVENDRRKNTVPTDGMGRIEPLSTSSSLSSFMSSFMPQCEGNNFVRSIVTHASLTELLIRAGPPVFAAELKGEITVLVMQTISHWRTP